MTTKKQKTTKNSVVPDIPVEDLASDQFRPRVSKVYVAPEPTTHGGLTPRGAEEQAAILAEAQRIAQESGLDPHAPENNQEAPLTADEVEAQLAQRTQALLQPAAAGSQATSTTSAAPQATAQTVVPVSTAAATSTAQANFPIPKGDIVALQVLSCLPEAQVNQTMDNLFATLTARSMATTNDARRRHTMTAFLQLSEEFYEAWQALVVLTQK